MLVLFLVHSTGHAGGSYGRAEQGSQSRSLPAGFRGVIACGGAGALVPELVMGHAVVLTGAVRDEGTSFHYLPAGRVVSADPGPAGTLAEATDEPINYSPALGKRPSSDLLYWAHRHAANRRSPPAVEPFDIVEPLALSNL